MSSKKKTGSLRRMLGRPLRSDLLEIPEGVSVAASNSAPVPPPRSGPPRPPTLASPNAEMLPRQKGELLLAYVAARAPVDGIAFFDASAPRASLCGANLRGGLLSRCNLQRADLRGADLRDADLRGADLRGADLKGADLRGGALNLVNLARADLRMADLSMVDLSGVKGMHGADLSGADLSLVRIDEAMRGARVDETTFYRSGWARPHLNRLRDNGVIFDGIDRLPLNLRPTGRADEPPSRGLVLRFSTRLTFQDTFILRGVLCAVVGPTAACTLSRRERMRGGTWLIEAEQRSDLQAIAEALQTRAWERDAADALEGPFLRRLEGLLAAPQLRHELSALVDRVEQIDLYHVDGTTSWRPPVEPDAALAHLLRKMFIPVELRWWLNCIPGGRALARALPPTDGANGDVVDATVTALAASQRVDAPLFLSLIEERREQAPEIRAVARLWNIELPAQAPDNEPTTAMVGRR
ncbi:MAG: pentapeptide repeat-containing protein [Myxococcota bacterium]